MTNPTASSAFEAAIREAAFPLVGDKKTFAQDGTRYEKDEPPAYTCDTAKLKAFSKGARWAREWTTQDVLANHPVVVAMAEATRKLRDTCMDGKLYGDHDKSVKLIADVTAALAAYREACGKGEGL